MTWLETSFLKRFTTSCFGGSPRPEAGHHRLLPQFAERRFELKVDLGTRNRDLEMLLARAGVRDGHVDLKLALGGLGLFPGLINLLFGWIADRHTRFRIAFCTAHQ